MFHLYSILDSHENIMYSILISFRFSLSGNFTLRCAAGFDEHLCSAAERLRDQHKQPAI